MLVLSPCCGSSGALRSGRTFIHNNVLIIVLNSVRILPRDVSVVESRVGVESGCGYFR